MDITLEREWAGSTEAWPIDEGKKPMGKWLILTFTHAVSLIAGVALGIYLLPILTAPPSVDRAVLAEMARGAKYTTEFKRDLKGSDPLHWGEGQVSVTADSVVHSGTLSPGPDYKLYLLPEFVDDEAGFLKQKDRALRVGDVKAFDGFVLKLPPDTNIDAYTTAVVWCEAFGEFITAGKYR
jgi:hypothetical protein